MIPLNSNTSKSLLRRVNNPASWAGILLAAVAGTLTAQTPPNNFLVHNLVSDLPNIADVRDASLVNPWGSGFGTSPFWIGNNKTGTSTLYNGYGTKIALTVTIPAAGGATTPGPVTGVMINIFSATNKNAFQVGTAPASFLFCSLDGLITGWNGAAGTKAVVLVDNSMNGAIYTGCTIGGTPSAPFFYAANLNSGKIETFDLNFKPVASATFANPALAAGLGAYNIQSFGGKLYVTYGKQNAQKNNVVFGVGNGGVASFDFNGNMLSNIAGGPLNAPWGVVLAPATFGPFANAILVGNFGDGMINAFNPTTGAPMGALADLNGNPIVIPGLWSLTVGSGAQSEDPGTVYFTAGIGGGTNGAGTATDPIQSHGLLGSIQAAPTFLAASGNLPFLTFLGNVNAPTGLLNGGSFASGSIAPNTWMSIKGSDLAPQTALWQISSATLPTALNNVSVTVNGEQAYVSFIGNQQINFLTPADLTIGSSPQIVVTNNGLASAPVTSPIVQPEAPSFFTIGTGTQGQNYIAATHADGSLIGPATIKTATGAKAGETITLYGTGFGATNPATPNGQVISQALNLGITPTVTIEGMVAKVAFAGLTGTGLYQLNVVVPAGLPSGDALVVALIGNTETQVSAFITIQ
jgi:uncharacterized protein (TIGR03118 family)